MGSSGYWQEINHNVVRGEFMNPMSSSQIGSGTKLSIRGMMGLDLMGMQCCV